MHHFRIEYDGERLFFRNSRSGDYNPYTISQQDIEKFEQWAHQYETTLKQLDPIPKLIKLGRDMFVWLDKVSNGWMQSLCAGAEPPLYVEFEVPLHAGGGPQAPSVSLAGFLIGDLTSPSQAAMRHELATRIEVTMAAMDEIDRLIFYQAGQTPGQRPVVSR